MKHLRNHLTTLLGFILLFLTFITMLAGCRPTITSPIVGKWESVPQPGSQMGGNEMSFERDGTITSGVDTTGVIHTKSTYTLPDANHITTTTDDPSFPNKTVVTSEYLLNGDNLTISNPSGKLYLMRYHEYDPAKISQMVPLEIGRTGNNRDYPAHMATAFATALTGNDALAPQGFGACRFFFHPDGTLTAETELSGSNLSGKWSVYGKTLAVSLSGSYKDNNFTQQSLNAQHSFPIKRVTDYKVVLQGATPADEIYMVLGNPGGK